MGSLRVLGVGRLEQNLGTGAEHPILLALACHESGAANVNLAAV